MIKEIMKKIRLVKISDYFKMLFIFPFAYVVSIFYRKINKDILLIGESKTEARDNGYWLFEYITTNKLYENVYYTIDFNSPDYTKVKKLGKCIDFGSFKHWVFYLSAKVIASSQKGDNPCPPLFYVLQNKNFLRSKFVFLQHGITISEAEWLYYDNTHFAGFVCGAKPEYDEVSFRYGYPKGCVKYLGFPRFDRLHDIEINEKQILVMPSWREWLTAKTDAYYKFGEGFDFENSEYFKKWNSFLKNEKLNKFLVDNDLELIFYPHRNLQQHIEKFSVNTHIKMASWKDYDIQQLLKESALLITDYSSVFMDFSYMKKPVFYYQFDYEKFREGQYKEGYFSYEKDGFGKVLYEENSLVEEIEKSYDGKFILSSEYELKINKFFPLYDENNSKRNYEFILEILKEN